jgi:hypothetical protein
MRSKSFWEIKLKEAQISLTRLRFRRERLTQRLHWSNHRLNRFKGELIRQKKRDMRTVTLTRLAKVNREMSKIRKTKIPYYEAMIAREPKTIWTRIRKGDGLNLTLE